MGLYFLWFLRTSQTLLVCQQYWHGASHDLLLWNYMCIYTELCMYIEFKLTHVSESVEYMHTLQFPIRIFYLLIFENPTSRACLSTTLTLNLIYPLVVQSYVHAYLIVCHIIVCKENRAILLYIEFKFGHVIQSPMNRYISTHLHGKILSVDFEEFFW